MFTDIKSAISFMKERQNLGIKPGLHRMEYMLEALHHPEKKLKVIHVGGTNGKGSVTSFLEEALLKHNYNVGTFTSPSLDRLHDHIQRNKQSITDDEFIQSLEQLYPVIQRLDEQDNSPTEFEILVMIAIVYLATNVDIAIFEVGMGGKEDSTNCLRPILSIITTIGLDHTSFLGESYAEIAEHKAGIIKPFTPIITGVQQKEALNVIERKASQEDAVIYRLGQEFHIKSIHEQTCTFIASKHSVDIEIQMKGMHQIENAAVALMGLYVLKEQGFNLNDPITLQALKEAHVPGRFEVISLHPTIIVDGAHNVEGIQTFVQTVKRYYQKKKKRLLFAVFCDKPFVKMLDALQNEFDEIIVTTFNHPRSAKREDFYEIFHDNLFYQEDWKLALDTMIDDAKEDEAIFVVGSLHFVGKVRKHFV
ncbi:bifunctional folylpolyglutamate synthase/dihydrofolate synthase [Radiobacillus deserti]|uniref:tetrahydrofolate synthase n=1 Tax=Radiobacillus deserti TaxID=2594883 RepID=A0A516KH72_9BACI|nr:folylpolyglutamate synthase/dihydrofolate synthase family protein [Radiobacillus deserti]QDP40751.1 bifunctional folylpolyglutamate synthase/dihydrofolate synthase [Radiobacillus deserti]